MKKFPLFLIVMLIFLKASVLEAQGLSSVSGTSRPDLANWNVISRSNISVSVSDSVTYYLGFDVTYQNPDNSREYVRQIRLLLPFMVVKSRATMDRNLVDAAVTYVTDGAEKELLKIYSSKSDPIIEIKWREKSDSKRGTSQLDGENEVWFQDYSGKWTYDRGVTVGTMMVSERFREFDNELLMIGQKYFLSKSVYNAHEVPYAYIVIALRAARGGK